MVMAQGVSSIMDLPWAAKIRHVRMIIDLEVGGELSHHLLRQSKSKIR
jgi:hypothetical protein